MTKQPRLAHARPPRPRGRRPPTAVRRPPSSAAPSSPLTLPTEPEPASRRANFSFAARLTPPLLSTLGLFRTRRDRPMFSAPLALALGMVANAPAPYVAESPPTAAVLRLKRPRH